MVIKVYRWQKNLMMKMYTDKAAKKKIKEDETITYCQFIYSFSIFTKAKTWRFFVFFSYDRFIYF